MLVSVRSDVVVPGTWTPKKGGWKFEKYTKKGVRGCTWLWFVERNRHHVVCTGTGMARPGVVGACTSRRQIWFPTNRPTGVAGAISLNKAAALNCRRRVLSADNTMDHKGRCSSPFVPLSHCQRAQETLVDGGKRRTLLRRCRFTEEPVPIRQNLVCRVSACRHGYPSFPVSCAPLSKSTASEGCQDVVLGGGSFE